MSLPTITTEILPTGGVVALSLSSDDQVGPWVLTRSIVGSALPAVTVYNGPPLSGKHDPTQVMPWIDAGDGTTIPLNPTLSYTWTFTTLSGTATTAAVQPICMITIQPDQVADLIIRIIKAGVESLVVPQGFPNKATVLHAMPLAGQPAIPGIFINEDLISQEHIGIGDSVNPDTSDNFYSVSAIVHRRYSVSVVTTTVQERSFYRDAIIGIFRTMCGPALSRLGSNITHRFQAADSQESTRDKSPGFYMSIIMLDLSGMFNVGVTTNFGTVAIIDPEPTLVPDTSVYTISPPRNPAAI